MWHQTPCHQVSKVDNHGYQKNQMPSIFIYNHGHQKSNARFFYFTTMVIKNLNAWFFNFITMVIKNSNARFFNFITMVMKKFTIPIDDIEPWFSNVFRKNQIPALKLL
jgi:hypothetical protein